MSDKKRVVIIGAGPGGYVSAIRASQLGFDTTIIEKENLGGTCLNEGCIPSKFLLKSSNNLSLAKDFDFYGIEFESSQMNIKKLNKRKSIIIKKLANGVKFLLEKNKVKIKKGKASFIDKNTIMVNEESLSFDYAIIATGASFKSNIQSNKLISHKTALELNNIPKSITILGANTIGVEFAYIYNSLGSKVILIDDKNILNEFKDKDISDIVENILNKNKIDFEQKNEVDLLGLDSESIIDLRERCGNIDDLNLMDLNIECRNGFINVNNDFKTNIDNIFAIGDVNGLEFWAHSASEQGLYVLDKICNKNRKYPYKTIPKCVYLSPEIASVGLTEEEAKSKGINVKVSKFPLASNGMSMILKDDKGFIKVIVGQKYKEVLGAQIVGNRATDIISLISLAIRLEATVDEMIDMVYTHPSIVEGIKESFLGIENISIHI